MIQIVSNLATAASQSFLEEKAKQGIALGATVAVTVAEEIRQDVEYHLIPEWLPMGELVMIASFISICLVIYSSYQKIKLQNKELDEKD